MRTIALTSLIAPKDQVSRAAKMLAEEFVRKIPSSKRKLLRVRREQPLISNLESTGSRYYQPSLRPSSV